MPSDFFARRCEQSELQNTCKFLTKDFSALIQKSAQQWLYERFQTNEFNPQWLFVAFEDNRNNTTSHQNGKKKQPANKIQAANRIQAALYVHVDDCSGTVLGYQSDSDQAESKLIPYAAEQLKNSGVKVWQVIATADKLHKYQNLRANGFSQPIKLVEMKKNFSAQFPPQNLDNRFCMEQYSESHFQSFAECIVATYEGSLDCPELNYVRTPTEVLRNLQKNVRGGEPFWYRAWIDDEPIGVLLLNPTLPKQNWELTYLGLLPKFRNQGLGKELLNHAIGMSSSAGAPGLTLTFDERNKFAQKLYEKCGFQSCGSYEVFLYIFKS
jgi:ribosomal protein S18 acetylase RimI-like enzyme